MIRAHDSVIVTTLSRLLIPLVQLYAVYILFFGQYLTRWRICGWSDVGSKSNPFDPRFRSRRFSEHTGEEGSAR